MPECLLGQKTPADVVRLTSPSNLPEKVSLAVFKSNRVGLNEKKLNDLVTSAPPNTVVALGCTACLNQIKFLEPNTQINRPTGCIMAEKFTKFVNPIVK